MRKIIADTNFLMSQFEYGVDLPSELLRVVEEPFSLVICTGTLRELSAISSSTGKRGAAARFVLGSLPKLRSILMVEEVESKGSVDEWIFKYAQKNKVFVATNDIPLRKRLRKIGVPVIGLKGKSKLGFI
jgi:rRNA-processing protein FCF1